ncbi:aromatic ring-hydroxylating dioxygenase subunit alpha [Achromobacter sp. GG226]|uniref:aromatic ring-hydroxylating dioxygenase subunit alpha n=1 Tax=Verticiella alkaliphila TaxID=2779529 RepID=UPI001C0B234B|nr:aromatic ring-hydroxylating dioxygenase subunit alpha [Verticiella sp. GG226]MBU4611689.1 aromatic ring-hydroxylating dioxygenase subunit alpha [Verticiella sp. GG226]
MSFIHNAWYVACWSDDVKPGALFSRTLLNQRVVFYRKADGQAAALQDRCPHRFIPLSMGKLSGDVIECAYHGLQFDCSGRCTKNPHGDGKIPAAAQVRSYPVEDRHGMLWIWMGEEAADPALIPDYSVLDAAAGYQVTRGCIHIAANYELMGENLLDLSHITYLHDGYLGSPEQVGADQTVKEEGGRLHCNRWMPNISVPGIFDMLYRRDGKPVDMWTHMTWMPPSCFLLDTGVQQAGLAEREQQGWYYGVHILTPETERTTHYHFAAALPAGTRLAPEDAATFAQMRRYAFEEQDKPIIDAQQAAIGEADFWSLKPVLLTVDAGPIRMRRSLEKLRQAEVAKRTAAAAPADATRAPAPQVTQTA